MDSWWKFHPEAFTVLRDRSGECFAFHISKPADEVNPAIAACDPIAARWLNHASQRRELGRSLLVREILDIEHGELGALKQGAINLRIKSTYVAMRPNLRYVYVPSSLPEIIEVTTGLGFRDNGTRTHRHRRLSKTAGHPRHGPRLRRRLAKLARR